MNSSKVFNLEVENSAGCACRHSRSVRCLSGGEKLSRRHTLRNSRKTWNLPDDA